MTYDEKQAKTYNAEYDSFAVIFADGSWKLYSKYGRAISFMRSYMGACKLVGCKLVPENLDMTETVLVEKH